MFSPTDGIHVAPELRQFLVEEVLPRAGIDEAPFWSGLAELVSGYSARNRELLVKRATLQAALDRWHLDHRDGFDAGEYRAFLEDIGYLEPSGPAFTVETTGIDDEIAVVPGPQLVVPVTNARYALNATNARWGSLYDAIYGSDVLGSPQPAGPYDPTRGAAVIAWAKGFLDDVVPVDGAGHGDAIGYRVDGGALVVDVVGGHHGLLDPERLVGFRGDPTEPSAVVLVHNGLHIELTLDRSHPVGATDPAGLSDVILEAAVTTIVDCEDSVATVDAADKTHAYRNWLGLMTGELTEPVTKNGETFTRRLAGERRYSGLDGEEVVLAGRALLLVRNVGLLMTTPAVLDRDGNEAFEGLVDALVTVACAKAGGLSPAGSVYVVKPKLHGPDEVAFAADVFAEVERILGLAANTVKLGVMDEERRTTLNLQACIRAASSRLAFINTGFLDRTGDEIHTSMEAGPMVPKTEMKTQRWLLAYENWNVDTGLACGLAGRAQIGKGMWAAPDRMRDMVETKIEHPSAGATCAWVPSPTAATLHATHYHRVDVRSRQADLLDRLVSDGPRATIDDLLTVPVADDPGRWAAEQIQAELDNNAQGILGYVVRWVDQGIGCSTVPDINGVGLMEDRATCRISSQHIANWLHHGVVTADQVEVTLRAMAEVVDKQNAADPIYLPMAPSFDGPAFEAARSLVYSGTEQQSGYTEPILHRRRRERKAFTT